MVTNSLQCLKAIPKGSLCSPMEKPLQKCNCVSCEISANFCFQFWTRMKVGNKKKKQTTDDLEQYPIDIQIGY